MNLPKNVNTLNDSITLPTGVKISWTTNGVGGRTFVTDEIGSGAMIWDTALISIDTVRKTVELEEVLQSLEKEEAERFFSYD